MSNTRAIVSGAVCATALCLGGLVGPPGAGLALLVAPLPPLVVGGVAGAAQAAAASLVAGGLLGGLLGWPVGGSFLALAGVPGVLAVILLRRAWRLEPVVSSAVGAMLLGGLLLAFLLGPPPPEWPATLAKTWQASFDGAVALYRDLGVSAEQLADLEAQRDDIAGSALRFLPAAAVVGATVTWLVNLRLSARWAAWPQLDSLSHWRVPERVIWVLIASGFALFAPDAVVVVVAGNLFAVALACYFAQGLSIVSYFFQRFGLPRGLRVLAYLVIAFQQVAAGLVVALGVFDLWGDFRHLTARAADAAVGSDTE